MLRGVVQALYKVFLMMQLQHNCVSSLPMLIQKVTQMQKVVINSRTMKMMMAQQVQQTYEH